MSSSRACFLWGMLGAFGVLIAAAVVVPQYADYRERAANTEMYNEASALRQAVESRILELGTVENSGLNIQTPAAQSYEAIVSREGIVILQGMQFGHVLVLMPSLNQDKVSWHCIGGPVKDMPLQCKGN